MAGGSYSMFPPTSSEVPIGQLVDPEAVAEACFVAGRVKADHGRMSEYQAVQRGPLRLKGGVESAAKRKKKEKEKKKIVDQTVSSKNQEEKKRALDKRTPAQLAYEKTQEKRQIERILKKASKTHKQRVEDFNRHLDTLTEHYDIPKVSWTK